PAPRGKYICPNISTGHVGYADYNERVAADDGDPKTLAAMRELKILFDGKTYDTMFPIAELAYHARGGMSPHLPGRGAISGDGRADAHSAVDAAGGLYSFPKRD